MDCQLRRNRPSSVLTFSPAVVRAPKPAGIRAFHSGHPWPRQPAPTERTSQDTDLYQLALDLARTPTNGNVSIDYIVVSRDGAQTSQRRTKFDIAQEYGLSTRDLRTFDLQYGALTHFIIRERSILAHLFDLRLIIQADRMLCFPVKGVEDSVIARVFMHEVQNRFRAAAAATQPHQGMEEQPFELSVLEAALSAVTASFEAEYLQIHSEATSALEKFDSRRDTPVHRDDFELHLLRDLLDITRRLAIVEKRARLTRDAVQDILNEDEDMAAMYLTDNKDGRPHPKHDHQQVEYMFEAFFKTNDTTVQDATSTKENIRRTEEAIRSILNVRRNQIMILEAKIEIAMLGMSLATLVAGWYGMNVVNFFEESTLAFAVLVLSSWLGIGVIWRYGLRRLRKIQGSRYVSWR